MHLETMNKTPTEGKMLDTKTLRLEKDSDGKVALSGVIDMLKELQQEVRESVDEIKIRKARLNRQKLYGTPKTGQRSRGTHLRLISGNDHSTLAVKQDSSKTSEKLLQPASFMGDAESVEASLQVRNAVEKNLSDTVPEMEELKEIIGLLNKLEN